MSEISSDPIVDLQRTIYSSRNRTRRWLHTSRRDRILEAIARCRTPSLMAGMEVGPGSGVYLPALCNKFQFVTAIDIESAHLESLQSLVHDYPNLRLQNADITSAKWDAPFDFILCSEVIEHVAHPKDFMKGVGQALASNGILVLSTPQPWSTMELTCRVGLSPAMIEIVRYLYKEPVLPTGHISLLSQREVIDMLRKNGFEILSSETFGLYLPILAEFGGGAALAIEQKCERLLTKLGATAPLWTQMYVARKK